MAGVYDLTLAETRAALAKGEVSPTELASAYIKAVEAARPLNAFITETPEIAMDMAKASEARIARGEGGAMEGIPIGVKDLFCTKGV
ncbi:MAG: amidase family protein, partial [Alphaproteobacteria bacterium]